VIVDNKIFYNNINWHYEIPIFDLSPIFKYDNSSKGFYLIFRLYSNSVDLLKLDLETEES
jgi:hypothetical protein